MDEIIVDIKKSIDWLDQRIRSENIVELGVVLDKLSIQSLYLATKVSEAYNLMNEAEDDYKHCVASFIKNYAGSRAKADVEAEDLFKDKKIHWTQCKGVYKYFALYLDRVDKIIESHRQRISVIKQTNLKNLTGI
jgi:hypothetical protein